jgi:hypothetical protein
MSQPPKTVRAIACRWLLLAALLLFLVLVQILFDPFSLLVNALEHARIHTELAQARSRWEAAGVADYDLVISGYTPLACIVTGTSVSVRDSQPPEKPDTGSWQYCQVPRSVPEGFAFVENSLGWDGRLQVSFDAAYGYVRYLSYDCNFSRGLFSPIVSDCTQGFRIDSFTPVSTP